MPTSISVAELAQRLHATDQPVLRLDFEAGTVVTDDRPAQGYALTGDAIVFESLAERNHHVAKLVYEKLRERLTDAPSLLYERGHDLTMRWPRSVARTSK